MYSLRPHLSQSDKWLLIHCTGRAKINLMDKSYSLLDKNGINSFTNIRKFEYNIYLKVRSFTST